MRQPRELEPAEPDLWPISYLRKHEPAIADALQHPKGDLVVSRLVHLSAYSAVLKVYSKQWQQYLAFKICLDPVSQRPNWKRSSDQYSALLALSQISRNHSEFRFVRPIAHIRTLGILVLEWLDGESALSRLDRSRTREERSHLFFNLGRWIAQFHRENGVSARQISKSALLRTRDLNSNPTVLAPFKSIYGRYRRQTIKLIEDSEPLICHLARLHGDYHLENVIISEQDTSVILDPSNFSRDLATHDLAIFLNYLRRLCVLPRGWRHLRSFSLYRTAFLGGYQLEGVEISAKLLIIIEAMDFISFLTRLRQKTSNPAKLFYLHVAYFLMLRWILKS